MNIQLSITKKTYYAIGIIAAALSLAGSLLYVPGIYIPLPFTVASIGTGLMLLLLLAAGDVKSREGSFTFLALLAQILYFFSGVLMKVCGALVWPLFAFPVWRDTSDEGDDAPLHTMAFVVMLAGAAQLLFSFVPLPRMWKALLAVAISACQAVLCWLLYGREKARQAGEAGQRE